MQRYREIQKIIAFGKSYFLLNFILLITLFLLVNSCRKDKKNLQPEISVELPHAGISVNAIDSIMIRATITDDSGPLSVSVYIYDGQNHSLTSPMTWTSAGNRIDINEFYYFSNKYIESGNYYLVIQAKDLENNVNTFVSITVSGVPLTLSATYLGIQDPSGLKIFCNDTTGVFLQVGFVSENIADFMINSYSQQLYLLGSNGCLSCYSLPDLQKIWEKCGLNDVGNIFITQLTEHEFLSYVTDANGFVKAFDKEGVLRRSFTIQSGSPESFIFTNSQLLVSVFNNQSMNHYIQTYSLSGGLLHSYMINVNPKKFFTYSLNSAIVFCETSGQTSMYTYNTEINYLYPFGTGFAEPFVDVVETPDNQYLLSTKYNMRVVEKDYGNSVLYAPGHFADVLKFEKTSGLLYVADSNNFYVYNYPNSQIIETNSFSGSILYFDFLYNK